MRKPDRKPREVTVDGAFEARITALACSKPPDGRVSGQPDRLAGPFTQEGSPDGRNTLRWTDAMIASGKDGALGRLRGLLSFKGK